MECLEYALLEWGLRLSVPLARRETDVQREYYYPLGRQGPVETVREFMAVPGQIGRDRARCVLLFAIDHARNVDAILLNTSLRSS